MDVLLAILSHPLVAAIVLLALLFDFLNGMHDAANSIATVVSTRVLSPRFAVIWAAFFNFAAYFIFEAHVANTIGKGLISPELIDNAVIFGALSSLCHLPLLSTWYRSPLTVLVSPPFVE